jgi:hypothetical protein
MVDHGLLYRMKTPSINPFYGYDVFPMHVPQRCETGYNGPVYHVPVYQNTLHDRAGPAVSLTASAFGTGKSCFIPDEIEQGHSFRAITPDQAVV